MGIPNLGAVNALVKPATVYALVDPRDSSPFYVGVTTRGIITRLSSHINDSINLNMRGARYEAIRAIHAAGLRTEIVDIETVPHSGWVEAEQFWIGYFRFIGAELTNVATGGPGATGAKQSLKTQQRRRDAAVGRDISHLRDPTVVARAAASNVSAQTGRKASPEARLNMSLAKRGEKHNNWGKKFSTETLAKMSAAMKGIKRPSGEDAVWKRAVLVEGVEYYSVKYAASSLSVYASTIRRWLAVGKAIYADGGPPPVLAPGKPTKGRATGLQHYKVRPIVIDGILYSWAPDAMAGAGISKVTLYRWLKSGRAQYADKAPL